MTEMVENDKMVKAKSELFSFYDNFMLFPHK